MKKLVSVALILIAMISCLSSCNTKSNVRKLPYVNSSVCYESKKV